MKKIINKEFYIAGKGQQYKFSGTSLLNVGMLGNGLNTFLSSLINTATTAIYQSKDLRGFNPYKGINSYVRFAGDVNRSGISSHMGF